MGTLSWEATLPFSCFASHVNCSSRSKVSLLRVDPILEGSCLSGTHSGSDNIYSPSSKLLEKVMLNCQAEVKLLLLQAVPKAFNSLH